MPDPHARVNRVTDLEAEQPETRKIAAWLAEMGCGIDWVPSEPPPPFLLLRLVREYSLQWGEPIEAVAWTLLQETGWKVDL
jgi:hypothetical protein